MMGAQVLALASPLLVAALLPLPSLLPTPSRLASSNKVTQQTMGVAPVGVSRSLMLRAPRPLMEMELEFMFEDDIDDDEDEDEDDHDSGSFEQNKSPARASSLPTIEVNANRTVAELQAQLKILGQRHTGSKPQLVERLQLIQRKQAMGLPINDMEVRACGVCWPCQSSRAGRFRSFLTSCFRRRFKPTRI